MISDGPWTENETATSRIKSVRSLLTAVILCLMLVNAGCNGAKQTGSNEATADVTPRADWGMSLLAGGPSASGSSQPNSRSMSMPRRIVLRDFVVYNTSLNGVSGSKANIIAFNELYSTQGSIGGLCNQNGPSVYWSYFTGTGSVLTSVILSADGTKVAFVENAAGGATLRVLKWKALEGTGVGAPVGVDQVISGSNWTTCTAGNSCIASIALNGGAQDTISAPFYVYNADVLYVGDNNGKVHKFTGVFNGTPAEVTTAWPVTINAGARLTSPVYDGVSGNIYVGDSTGRLSLIREIGSTVGACGSGSPPCLSATHLAVGANGDGAIVDGPIVDGTNGMVFAVNGTESDHGGAILQAPTSFASSVSFIIGRNGVCQLYHGAFDNTYIASSKPNVAGHMYICGKDQNGNFDLPAVYQLSFTPSTGVLSGVGSTPLTGLATDNSDVTCSPVTEFNNAGTSTDWIFFSVGNNAASGAPIPSGSACRTNNTGCVISINVTGNPTWPPINVNNAKRPYQQLRRHKRDNRGQ